RKAAISAKSSPRLRAGGRSTCAAPWCRRSSGAANLLHLRAGVPDHLREAPDLALDVGGELVGRAGDDLSAIAGEALLRVGLVQELHDLGVQPLDDRARSAGGGDHALPRGKLVARHARFLQG